MDCFETAKRVRAVTRGLVLMLLFAPAPQAAPGETNAPPRVPSNRWLVIVQTTSSMAPRAAEAANLAAMLVATGMGGQMDSGDTLGLWTFDDSLHTGAFPLQYWTPPTRKSIADRVFDFVKAQKFAKEGHLSYVLYDAQKVIKNSDFITVVLITDGMEDLHGTPFDEKVNRVYQTWRKDQAKAHIPFVTALRAEHGQLTNCAVTVAPWPLEMPPPSPELLALRTPKPPPGSIVVTVTNAPVILPPLIVTGKKHEAPPPPASEPQADSTNSNVNPSPPTATAASDQIPKVAPAETMPKPIPPAPEVIAAASPSAPQATNATVATTELGPPKPEPASTPAAAPRPEPVAPATATPAVAPAPAPNQESVTIADLLSRKNGWIIPLGIAGLVIASFALGIVFSMFRRMRAPQRISLVAPKPEPEKSDKTEKI